MLYVNDSLEGSTEAEKRKWGHHAGAKKVTAKNVSQKNQMKKVNGLDVQTSFFHLLFSRKFRPLETNDVHGSAKCKQSKILRRCESK
jgi:hypothetical protein